jgi:hypothetical protein
MLKKTMTRWTIWKPEGVVEIVVAEHHPKGLMAMGFADGGLVEAMVYVPGVGFVPQIQAATRSSQKKTDEDTRAETREGPSGRGGTDTGKSMSEMSPMEQAAFGGSLSGPLGGAIEAVSKGVVGSALGLASPLGVERGYSLATGVPTAAQQAMKSVDLDIAKAKEMYAMSAADLAQAQADFSGPIGNQFGATQNQIDRHADAVGHGTAPTVARGYSEGGMINSDSSFEEGQVLPTSDIFSEGVYAQVNIDRSVDSENVVESDKVITAPVAFSSAPGKTAYLAYITPEEAASLRQAKQGFSSEGNGLEVSDGQYQHLGPKGLMSFNGDDGSGTGDDAGGGVGDSGDSDGQPGDHGGGMSDEIEDLEPEEVEEEEKPTDPYEGYTYVKGIGYVPTSRRATSIESASLSSIFTPGFLRTIGLMGDPNEEL